MYLTRWRKDRPLGGAISALVVFAMLSAQIGCGVPGNSRQGGDTLSATIPPPAARIEIKFIPGSGDRAEIPAGAIDLAANSVAFADHLSEISSLGAPAGHAYALRNPEEGRATQSYGLAVAAVFRLAIIGIGMLSLTTGAGISQQNHSQYGYAFSARPNGDSDTSSRRTDFFISKQDAEAFTEKLSALPIETLHAMLTRFHATRPIAAALIESMMESPPANSQESRAWEESPGGVFMPPGRETQETPGTTTPNGSDDTTTPNDSANPSDDPSDDVSIPEEIEDNPELNDVYNGLMESAQSRIAELAKSKDGGNCQNFKQIPVKVCTKDCTIRICEDSVNTYLSPVALMVPDEIITWRWIPLKTKTTIRFLDGNLAKKARVKITSAGPKVGKKTLPNQSYKALVPANLRALTPILNLSSTAKTGDVWRIDGKLHNGNIHATIEKKNRISTSPAVLSIYPVLPGRNALRPAVRRSLTYITGGTAVYKLYRGVEETVLAANRAIDETKNYFFGEDNSKEVDTTQVVPADSTVVPTTAAPKNPSATTPGDDFVRSGLSELCKLTWHTRDQWMGKGECMSTRDCYCLSGREMVNSLQKRLSFAEWGLVSSSIPSLSDHANSYTCFHHANTNSSDLDCNAYFSQIFHR